MKQTYEKPELSIVLAELATMLAMSNGKLDFNQGETADQMSNQRNEDRGWGDLWKD